MRSVPHFFVYRCDEEKELLPDVNGHIRSNPGIVSGSQFELVTVHVGGYVGLIEYRVVTEPQTIDPAWRESSSDAYISKHRITLLLLASFFSTICVVYDGVLVIESPILVTDDTPTAREAVTHRAHRFSAWIELFQSVEPLELVALFTKPRP